MSNIGLAFDDLLIIVYAILESALALHAVACNNIQQGRVPSLDQGGRRAYPRAEGLEDHLE